MVIAAVFFAADPMVVGTRFMRIGPQILSTLLLPQLGGHRYARCGRIKRFTQEMTKSPDFRRSICEQGSVIQSECANIDTLL